MELVLIILVILIVLGGYAFNNLVWLLLIVLLALFLLGR